MANRYRFGNENRSPDSDATRRTESYIFSQNVNINIRQARELIHQGYNVALDRHVGFRRSHLMELARLWGYPWVIQRIGAYIRALPPRGGDQAAKLRLARDLKFMKKSEKQYKKTIKRLHKMR